MTDSDVDMMKYKIRGKDFVIQLLLILGILQPITNVMIKAQSVSLMVWEIPKLAGVLQEHLQKQADDLEQLKEAAPFNDLEKVYSNLFPLTRKHAEDTKKDKFYQQDLLEDWLIVTNK